MRRSRARELPDTVREASDVNQIVIAMDCKYGEQWRAVGVGMRGINGVLSMARLTHMPGVARAWWVPSAAVTLTMIYMRPSNPVSISSTSTASRMDDCQGGHEPLGPGIWAPVLSGRRVAAMTADGCSWRPMRGNAQHGPM